MEREGKWYISFGCGLWDKRVSALLNKLKSKTKHMLCGFDVNDKNITSFVEKCSTPQYFSMIILQHL